MTVLAMWFLDGGGLLGGMGGFALPVLVMGAMYFLMIVPGQKKQKVWQQMLNDLKTGDRVTTSGGLRGTILSVKDDIVVLRIQPDNLRMEFVKSAISSVTTEEVKG